MKKISAFLFIFFLLSASPSRASNIFDFIFPPVQMKTSTRSAPNAAIAPEVPSNDTYSNTLKEKTFSCDSVVTASKHWEPVIKGTGITDANGNEIKEYVDYTANGPIEGKLDIKNLSNDYYRNYQTFFARGGIKCTEERARSAQTNLTADGVGAATRATPNQQIMYYRGLFITEIAKSLDQKNPLDTVVQDYQIAWSCGGLCQEIGNSSSSSSCRPVFVSEILLGLKDNAYYYPTLDSSPETFPSSILSNIQSYYANNCSSPYGCYSSRSKGKSFSPLSKSTYELLYDQLNFIPKGNVNTKLAVTKYTCTDSSGEPSCPSIVYVDRTLPNAAAANADQNLSFLVYDNQPSLSNPSYCDNVQNSSEATDHPLDTSVPLSAAFSKLVKAGNSLDKEVKFNLKSTVNSQGITNTQVNETALFNLIPYSQAENLEKNAFSSTIGGNNPPDMGYRANSGYKVVQSLLNSYSLF